MLSGRGKRIGGGRSLALLAMAALVIAAGWPVVAGPARAILAAQTATPAPGDCEVPAAVATSDEPAETPDAETPAPDDATTPVAPTRRGVATPGAAATAAATARLDPEAALTAELTAVATALAACFTDGRSTMIATLATERYLGQLYSGGVPLAREDYLAIANELDVVPVAIRSVRDVRRTSGGRATAEVVSVVGHQLLRARWTFIQAARGERTAGRIAWRVDGEEPLSFEPPADAERLVVAIEEYAYTLVESEAPGPVVVLEGANGGFEDHELLVLRLADEVTTGVLLRTPGPGLPDGVDYVGQLTVPAGQRAELVLVDLEPGNYTIVCLFLSPSGLPHLASGMAATFTVTD